ncbi:MAG TPA: topoisomerase DNA-binding C4 zinc finger domain-containing protein [Steroidobacteraceae bacterium]|nr:topoisomerase DNA-binding C4 zinc finger domain-containing protein [Steroidobacteraceae bacterium]
MATHRQHVQRLRGKSAPSDERHCPRCGKPMILRTAKRGDNIGNQFWGCSGYPNCNAIQNLN